MLAENITDLVRGTFNSVRKDTLTNLMMPAQKYYALNQVFKEQRTGFSGLTVQEELVLDDNGAARHIDFDTQDVYREKDAVQLITTNMRHTETSYAYNKLAILAQGDNAAKIYDYLKLKRVQALGSLHGLCESDLWGKPDTDTATLAPYGLFYSLVYGGAGSGNVGFTGGNPSGFSAVYGLDTSATSTIANIDRYRNYSAQFTNIQSADFLDLLWDAYMKVSFETPIDLDEFRYGAGNRCQCYTTAVNLRNIRHMMEGRNENLGWELVSMFDKMGPRVTYQGNPINWVPALDGTGVARPINSSSNPFVMMNWDAMNVRFLEGNYMRETGPNELIGFFHNKIGVNIDLSWQSLNRDRRRMALLAQADPLA